MTPFPPGLLRPYNPVFNETWKVVDRFDSTYWSGLDVSYYAETVKLDEVVQLTYQINERLTPLYGYADHVSYRMVHGQRLVTGEFSMNFKRDGYVFTLLDLVKNPDPAPAQAAKPVSRQQATKSPSGGAAAVKDLSGDYLAAVVQEMRQAELYSSPTPSAARAIPTNTGMFEIENGFNLNIIFGARLNGEQQLRFDASNLPITDRITIDEKPSGDPSRTPTGVRIEGVSIGGFSRMIGDDGRPVMETYSFMAKNLRPLTPSEILAGFWY